MGFFSDLIDGVKDNIEAKKQREAEEREWVLGQEATQVICDYFYTYFDKGNPGYDFLKKTHQEVWVKVMEFSVQIQWISPDGPARSVSDIKNQYKHIDISFSKIYSWKGGNTSNYYTELPSKVMRSALETEIYSAVKTLEHIKYNGSIKLRLFG